MTKLEARARELADECTPACSVCDKTPDQPHWCTKTATAEAMVKLAREHAERAVAHFVLIKSEPFFGGSQSDNPVQDALRKAEQ